jgi:Putative Ig domain
MQHRHLKHPAGVRELAICLCALATLFAGPAAQARSRWRMRLVIYGTPATTDVAGQAYSFTPSARGPSGHTLTFSISGKPAWASFSTTNGQLSGTPTTANVGKSGGIVIGVSDGIASTSLAPFTITVTSPTITNTSPTISGTPPTAAKVGTPYAFTPKAGDTDGDALSFSVQNLPSWATFSIASGTLSGTPAAANVGTDSNIVISVSDGHSSAALAPFSITVSQPTTSGGATLTWTAPTTNTNGSALTDLAGYHIHYGTSPSALATVVNIANPGTTTYTVTNLASGTWYFATSAYTTSGVESALSNIGSKSIP